ncbi:MAG: anti-sigma factor [Hyphomicrobiaceae bacterium]|nr:anti-sigma factor [Hyphomicrobiaceae bacterium]
MTNNEKPEPIEENDLHAYVDGQLDADRAAEVEAYLAGNPAVAADVASWREQNEAILAAFGSAGAVGPDDLALLQPARRPVWSRFAGAAAAAVVLLGVGGAGGFLAHDRLLPPAVPEALPAYASFAGEAGDAYLTYASEVRHVVEVPASDSAHLTSWLGKRLDYEFTIPDLSKEGLSFIGGRLLPINGQPGAMLMYEDQAGTRLAVMIAHNDGARDTAFQFAADGDVGTFYWIDGDQAYAITGRYDRARLRAISGDVYAHFEG